jgi:hypothetical protein
VGVVAPAPSPAAPPPAPAAGAGSTARHRRFDAGAYVVDLAQPQGKLARAILEPDAKLNDAFVEDELAKRERNDKRGKSTPQEQPGFYDITAWSLPFAFGVEAYWLGDAQPITIQPLGAVVEPDGGLREPFAPEGRVVGGRGIQAFVFPYQSTAAARLALALMREGYRLAATPYELRAGGKLFPRGSIVLRTQRNPESLTSRIATLARETGVEVTAVDTQYADQSTTGIGSEDLRALVAPKILVAAGDAISQTSYGALWFMLEREIRYPFTAVDVAQIAGTDLSKFNVVILPDGSPGGYARALGKGGAEKLKAWVEAGGTLVSLGGPSSYLATKDVGLTSARVVGADDDEKEKPNGEAKKPAPEKATAGAAKEKTKKEKAQEATPPAPAPEEVAPVPETPLYVPGAIFRAAVDRTYFMSYGYEDDFIPVPVNTDAFLRPSDDGANVVSFPTNLERLSGFVWPRNTLQLLRGTSYVVSEPVGDGHVILFAEDVLFRRLWRGLDRLFLNSVVFAPGY